MILNFQRILLLFFFGAIGSVKDQSAGCDSLYYFKNKVEVTFLKYNAKGDKTGKDIGNIEEISESNGILKSTYHLTKLDINNKVIEKSAADISCDRTGLKIGFQITGELTENSKNMFYSYPSNMVVGQSLEGNLSFNVKSIIKGKKTDIFFSISNRKVVAEEKTKVPFGIFDTFKIQYDLQVKFKFLGLSIPMNLKIYEWYCPKLGIIKTEDYNKDGKLEETSVLYSIVTK